MEGGICPLCQEKWEGTYNKYRPFCGPVCKNLDLFNWLNEEYFIDDQVGLANITKNLYTIPEVNAIYIDEKTLYVIGDDQIIKEQQKLLTTKYDIQILSKTDDFSLMVPKGAKMLMER